MARQGVERRLAAILSADVVGYSRLMEEDEDGTLAVLQAHRAELIDPTIAAHRGRIVKLMGDGALVEFASVIDAVECAVDVQRGMANRNTDVPGSRRIEFRIGINLGDVIIEGDDIYGDGVNVAARLQELADPGGVCIAGTVFDQVGRRPDLTFDDLGEQQVKNIDRPIRAYVVRSPGAEMAGAAVATATPQAVGERSIAVLPFANMSADPEQDFFADGITEDIITALSQISDLFVIGRTSTFAYKGQAIDLKRVGRELGVRYVLEGSVRRAGNRLRVTGQLIDASDGHHLWADRYDRDLDDIFAVQDDITRNVATALQITLSWGETSRLWQGGTRSFEAWQCMAQAFKHWYRFSAVDNAEARRLCERAVEIDPEFGSAWALLAWTCWMEARYFHAPNPDALIERFERLADKVMALGNVPAQAYHLQGARYMLRGELEASVDAFTRAVEAAPSNAEMHGLLGIALIYAGRPTEGLACAETAIRLSPRPPDFVLSGLVEGHRWTGALDEALAAAQRGVAQSPNNYIGHVKLTSILIDLGRENDAREAAKKVLALDPKFSVEAYGRTQDYANPAHRQHVVDGLRKAGLPE